MIEKRLGQSGRGPWAGFSPFVLSPQLLPPLGAPPTLVTPALLAVMSVTVAVSCFV